MDPNYKPLYQKAQSLEHQVYDAIDDHNHPNIRVIRTEMHALIDDMESNRHPRTVEDRIKTIQHQLIQIRAQGGQAMDYSNVDHFHRNFEDMRQDLRRFRNY
jgi:YesN/AraC family two-component response regulator